MSDSSYTRRNEVGHLVRVHLPPPTAVESILAAYVAAFRAPPPDDWRDALARLQRAAAQAQPGAAL